MSQSAGRLATTHRRTTRAPISRSYVRRATTASPLRRIALYISGMTRYVQPFARWTWNFDLAPDDDEGLDA